MEKNPRFDTYISIYAHSRIDKEVRKLFLNPHLKMQVANITLERFNSIFFVLIDIEYEKNVFFTHIFL